MWDPDNLKAVHHDVEPRCNRIRNVRSIEAARADIARITGTPTDWTW